MKISLTQSLFALVAASVAVLLAIAGYVSFVPSDGQFWSIDPKLSPETAAEQAFMDGAYHFLGARVFFNEAKEADSYNFRMWNLLEKETGTSCWGFDVG